MSLWKYAIALGPVLLVSVGTSDYSVDKCEAWADGDVQIGILSSCYCKVENLYDRQQPEMLCSGFCLSSFVHMLAVIHTIETINNSSFLPGVRLGYYICDTCSDASKAIQSTARMLSENGTGPGPCDLTLNPRVKAIIGPRYSEVALSVARLLSLYMVPQISSTASAETLSDRLRYPAFLRTVPSDIHQTRALAELMSYYGWDWVGVVHGDDDYGHSALHSFLTEAVNENICTAFEESVPHLLDNQNIATRIQEVANIIQTSNTNVVLLILKEELVKKLFTEILKRNISLTWIATDSWSMSQDIAKMEGINEIGNILGFSFITGPLPGFEEYLQKLTTPPGVTNKLIEMYQKLDHKEDITEVVDISIAYGDRLAVLTIAHALKKLLDCNQTTCPGEKDFPPWKLLKELKNINFTLDNQTFFFNTSGNFVNGYDLIHWAQNVASGQRDFVVVGHYNLDQKQVTLMKAIKWYNSGNMKPVSLCSEECLPGTAKQLSKTSCCHNCTKCLEGTYSNGTNVQRCLPCENGTWSLIGWTNCTAKTDVYWDWHGKHATVILTFVLVGFFLLFVNLIIYIVYCKRPVMKQAGGYIMLLIMLGLALSFSSLLLFMGKPNDHTCRARQAFYGFGFSLTVSCILVKALRTYVAFLPRHRQHNVKKFYKPPVIITIGTLIQVLICIFWLIFDSPSMEIVDFPNVMEISFHCKEGSGIGFAFMLCYIAVLALICFVLALRGRKVPHRFNETGHIILSMLIYLFVWVCFTPIYVAKIPERYSIQAAAILVSSYGVIFFHLVPKWYMALCKKKDEVSKEAYIAQACSTRTSVDSGISQSSILSVPSVTGMHTSPSQSTMNSDDAGVCSTVHTTQSMKQFRNYQSITRRRYHRRSI
ncbi:olfactory receptor CB1 [Brachyhypopomus gauderio]|uniref:olfactory receptor CB1 n=1 Tax=Brachyhypopomus gauderio TaxID=698409 RepID=UPI004041B0C2